VTGIAPRTDPPPDGDVHGGMQMEGVQVKVHPSLCEGWGQCRRMSSGLYPLDEEGCIDVHRMEVPAERAYDAWLGAAACPEHAITVIGRSIEYWLEQVRRRAFDREGSR